MNPRVLVAAIILLTGGATARDVEAQRSYPVDLQVYPVTQSARRQAIAPGDDAPISSTSTIRGIEAFLLPSGGGLGIFGRHHTSSLGDRNAPLLQEAGLLIGDGGFRLEAAYSARRHLPQDSVIAFLRGGFAATSILGTSGVALRLRAGYFVPIDRFNGGGQETDGWEGETTLAYTWDRYPLSAQLGYRIERLRVVDFEEETSALTLGVGIWMQRRR